MCGIGSRGFSLCVELWNARRTSQCYVGFISVVCVLVFFFPKKVFSEMKIAFGVRLLSSG